MTQKFAPIYSDIYRKPLELLGRPSGIISSQALYGKVQRLSAYKRKTAGGFSYREYDIVCTMPKGIDGKPCLD